MHARTLLPSPAFTIRGLLLAFSLLTVLGAFSEAYGVGRSSGEPGIFIAAPVYADGLLVGVVIAKVGIARLRHWVAHAGTFVADDNGDHGTSDRRLPSNRLVSQTTYQPSMVQARPIAGKLVRAPC